MIKSFEVEPGVMNAACNIAKTPEDVAALANTKIGAIVVGSITVNASDGNPEPRWFDHDTYALNSFGMPNGGASYYAEYLPAMIDVAHKSGKQFILSVAGFNAGEYGELASLAEVHGPDVVELNLGCPNVLVDGVQKPIASFDTDYIVDIVTAARSQTNLPLTLKLSPYSNPAELARVAQTITDLDTVSGVVTSNTFPNSLMFDSRSEPVLAVGVGGLSGAAIKPFALGQVQAFRQKLPDNIAVIGAGGIESRRDVRLFRQAGASAVQAATYIVRNGHASIDDLV